MQSSVLKDSCSGDNINYLSLCIIYLLLTLIFLFLRKETAIFQMRFSRTKSFYKYYNLLLYNIKIFIFITTEGNLLALFNYKILIP